MREDILGLYQLTVQEIQAHLGQPARLVVDEPTTLRGEGGGRYERVAAVWFIPNEHGQPWNSGFHLDQITPTRIRVEMRAPGHHVSLDLAGKDATSPENLSRLIRLVMPDALREDPMDEIRAADPVPELGMPAVPYPDVSGGGVPYPNANVPEPGWPGPGYPPRPDSWRP